MNATGTPQRSFAERPWVWRVAVGFVLATLVALVVVPWVVQQRVDALREEVAVAEPARTLVIRWQFNLTRQLAAIDEQLLRGDTTELDTYRNALQREMEIRRSLAPLVRRLGPAAVERFAVAAALADHWHARVREEEVFRYGTPTSSPSNVSRELELFERVLAAVASVDAAIAAIVLEKTEQIRAAERTGLIVTMLLGALALLAAGTVVAIQARVRSFGAEAERRRSQAASALVEMSASEESRNRLLRGITHDVKNPLGAAKGYIELLNLGVKSPILPEQKPLLEGVERSINTALEIIDDMLEVARSSDGVFSLNRVHVDVNDVAAEAAAAYSAAARTAGHSVEVIRAPGPIVVRTDPARVRQVLDNLLSNAIKYTPPPGRITVRVRRTTDGGAPGPGTWAMILVSDTGPGIPPDKRETVFHEYTRLDEHDRGHGLGLAIARGIARRLGGDLTIADSQPGATFVLWLPIEDDLPAPANAEG